MMVGDSGVDGGISASRNTAGGSENIINGATATAITAVKIMSGDSVATSSNKRSAVNIMNGSGESSSNGDNVGKDNAMVVATIATVAATRLG